MQGHELFDPWAPHPVVNKHICFGGGGGGGGSDEFTTKPPSVPDYTQYISTMTNIGQQGQGWSKDLYDWAKAQGIDLNRVASTVSTNAGNAATSQQQTSDELMQDWRTMSKPLYEAQQRDAMRMIGNLPQTEEEYAGKYGADAAMAIDQSKAAATRAMAARGLAPNAAATGALDTAAGTQRALATTAGAETGRLAARTEARGVTGQALTQEQAIPNVAGTEGALATQNRTQQASVPMQAAATSSGLYQPAMGMYSASYPYMAQWGQTMGQDFNERLASYNAELQAYKVNQEAGAYTPATTMGAMGMGSLMGGASKFLGGMGGMGGGGGGGPMAVGGAYSTADATGMAGGAGMGGMFEKGGAIDTVPPTASPSGGRRTDDVHAALSVGEFVMPKRTVDWYGDKFFHKLIEKADRDQGQPPQPVGAEEGPSAAIMTQPPMFRSEGART